MKIHDEFTAQRERQEHKLGLTTARNKLREQITADIEKFIANGGHIQKCAIIKTEREKRVAKVSKQKLSMQEFDRRLREFAKAGKITLRY